MYETQGTLNYYDHNLKALFILDGNLMLLIKMKNQHGTMPALIRKIQNAE